MLLRLISAMSLFLLNLLPASAQQPNKASDYDTLWCKPVETESRAPGDWKGFLCKVLSPDTVLGRQAGNDCVRLTLYFKVGRDGSVSNVKIAFNDKVLGLEKLCLAIAGYPEKWIPATRNGRPINSYRRELVELPMSCLYAIN